MTQVRLELDEYSTRVLDVVKGRFGLKNRSEALMKFIIEEGSDFVPLPLDEDVLKELDQIYETHIKKHGRRSMSEKELDKILDL